MARQEIRIELLLGRAVIGLNGRAVGRLEEVQAELQEGRCLVTEFHVGSYAIFERLAAWGLGRTFLHVLGARRKHGGYRVPWEQLDLSDPERPRLRCQVGQLKTLFEQSGKS
jgi:sporulation protein YlmC with PRC-barrel domain